MVFSTLFTSILSNALLTGLISSLIAALFTLLISYLYNKWKDKKRYGKLTGTYSGYGYKEDTSEWELEDQPQSNATITYLQKNILDIEVKSLNKHDRYIWKGQIYMESEIHGSISWRYIKWSGKRFGDKNHKYGYKKITLIEDVNSIYFYMSPELGDGFEKAVFIQTAKKYK